MTWMQTNSTPAGASTFRTVLEDPAFTRDVVWREGETREQDGSTAYDFGDPEEIELLVTRPDADQLEQLPERTGEDIEYVMAAFLDRGITQDDRILIEEIDGRTPYRVGAPEVTDFDGDRFAWYALTRDRRGGTGDDPDSGDEDDEDDGGGDGDDDGDGGDDGGYDWR
jgi:hypothetical protein